MSVPSGISCQTSRSSRARKARALCGAERPVFRPERLSKQHQEHRRSDQRDDPPLLRKDQQQDVHRDEQHDRQDQWIHSASFFLKKSTPRQRSPQWLETVQYTAHEQREDGLYTDGGLVYTLQDNSVAAIRVFGLDAAVEASALEAEADTFALNMAAPVPVVDVIRYNRPGQAKPAPFGLNRTAWMRRLAAIDRDRSFVDEDAANVVLYAFRDYLLGRRCPACGKTFADEEQTNRCPFCGAENPDWIL